MKLIDWQTYAIGRVANREDERAGQALYNALREKRPDLEGRVWQTEYDTFDNDEAMPALFNWVAEHWNDQLVPAVAHQTTPGRMTLTTTRG